MRLNKDNVINAICIFGIVISFCIMLIVILKSFYSQQIDISFIKDIFSIGATLAAALIAISLFNDWKEQHNKTVLAPEALIIYKALEADIMTLARVTSTIKHSLNESALSENGEKVLESFGEIIDMREQRVIELKFFSTLSKNYELDQLTTTFYKEIDNYQKYMFKIFDDPKNHVFTKEILDYAKQITRIIVQIIYALKESISNYILLK